MLASFCCNHKQLLFVMIYIYYMHIYIYFQKLQTRKGNCNYFLSLCTNTFTSLYSPQNVQWRTLDLSLHSSFVYTNTSASIYIIDMFVVKSCVLKQYRIYTGSFGSGHTLETNRQKTLFLPPTFSIKSFNLSLLPHTIHHKRRTNFPWQL